MTDFAAFSLVKNWSPQSNKAIDFIAKYSFGIYLGNFYGFVVGAVFAMLYVIIMNRRIVGKLTKKLIHRR